MIRFSLRLTAFILLCFYCGSLSAQRIFLLSAGDTSERSGLAFSTGPDLRYVFDAFYANVPGGQLVAYNNPMADFADGSSRNLSTPWEGPDVRAELADLKQKMLTALDNCPAGADDAIVVFYSGHGAYDDEGHFLLMPDGETRLHRKMILERMGKKNPRLAVLITDSCNLHVPAGAAPGPAAMLIPPQKMPPLFDSLFVRSRGVVDINSSSEGQESIGAIGGGLLTISLAYMGNRPNFKSYPGFTRPRRSEMDQPGKAGIPSIDYSMAMGEFFGRVTEHDMHGNFDPNEPPFGVLFEYGERRLDWLAVSKLLVAKVDALFKTVAPKGWDTTSGGKQMTQTPRFYSLAATEGAGPLDNPSGEKPIRWSRPVYRPEAGDMILEINGRRIRNFDDYYAAVKNSPQTMTFVLGDAKSGKKLLLRTELNPPGADSRFGVGGENAPGGGVRVKYVMPGYPGSRCQLAE